MPTQKRPVFSICVPSCNRGRKAWHLVERLLPEMDDDWELLVLDNASHEETEFYDQIRMLAATETRLVYIRHPFNRAFHGNYLASLTTARAPWILLCSDEDWPNLATMRALLPVMRAKNNLGVLRGTVAPNPADQDKAGFIRQDGFFAAGDEALLHYGLTNTYMTGTLYHLALVSEKGLLERLRTGLEANHIYPHLYLELLIASQCDIMTTAAVVATKGEPQRAGSNAGQTARYHSTYSFGNRIDQVVALRDALVEAVNLVRQPFDRDLFLTMYLRLCSHSFWQLLHNSR
ncbi:MAG: glycosyltransferase [Magnetococcales bacterium]|nr:glycosyltransferase [Magnetococcales bacterium]